MNSSITICSRVHFAYFAWYQFLQSTSKLTQDAFVFHCADICATIALESVSSTKDHLMYIAFPPHTDLGFPIDDLVKWKNDILAKHWDAVL